MPETTSQTLRPESYPSSSRECQDAAVRTTFGTIDCQIRSYPSFGGVVLGTFTAIELVWLGISRSQPSRSQYPQTEDEFAFQMLRLGSHWLKSQSLYDKQSSQVSGGYSWPDNYPPELNVIYPFTGRIWVLTVRSGESGPADWARVRMAFTMDERCAILEEMRAKLYTLVDIFQDIAKSLEDGAAIGRRW